MPVTLVTGPANAAKAGRVLGAFREHADRGDAPFLVVPTASDRDAYARELLAGRALVGGRVLTWEDLVGLLARRLGIEGRVIGPLRRRTLVRRAILDCEGRLGKIGEASSTTGFTTALEAVFRELGRAGIDSGRLREIESELDSERRDGIAELLGAYEAIIGAEGVLDRERQALAVMRGLEQGGLATDGNPLLAYGFSELTVVQRRVMSALGAGCEVTVSLPADGRTRVGLAEHTVEAFARGGSGGVPVQPLAAPRDPVGPGLLEKHLFSAAARGAAGSAVDSVRVAVASGTDAMAAMIACEVEECLAAGVEASEIAIVLPSGFAPEPIVAALRDAGREASWQRTAEFGRTALGGALIGLLRCSLVPAVANSSDVLALAKAVGEPEEVDRAERLDRSARARGDRRAAPLLEQLAREGGRTTALVSQVAAGSAPASIAGVTKSAARDILAHMLGRTGGRLRVDEVEQAAALSAVTVGMNDVALILPAEGAEAMIEELASMTLDLTGAVARPGAVQVTDALSIRARSFDTVIVCGMEDGLFPSSFVPDPFLEDAAAEGLELGDERLSGSEVHARTQREQFAICAARARRRLVLARRRTDDAGEELARSPFLDEALRLLGLPFDHGEDASWAAGRLQGSVATRTGLRLEASERGGSASPGVPDRLGPAATAAIAADLPAVASPTRLEKYTCCPARWLAEDVLAPRDFDQKSEPMERGTLVHAALEAAIGTLVREGLGPLVESNRARVEEVVEAVLADAERSSGRSVAVRVRVEEARRILSDWIDLEIERGDGWEPLHVEMGFVEGGEHEPLDLGDGLTVSGTVDRVDRVELEDGGERIIIRDYKTGASKAPRRSAKPPRSNDANRQAGRWDDEIRPVFQAPLYLLAASRALGIEPGGAFYETLKDGERRGAMAEGIDAGRGFKDVVPPERLAELIESMVARAKAVIGAMGAGAVAPDEDCECPHPWLCGRRV